MCHRPVRGSAGLPAGLCGVAAELAAGVVGAVLCDGLGSVLALGLGSSETLLKISEPNGMRPAWAA